MKKTLILSLTFVLAGAFTGLATDMNAMHKNLNMAEFSKSVLAIEPETAEENIDENYTISKEDFSIRKNGNTPNRRQNSNSVNNSNNTRNTNSSDRIGRNNNTSSNSNLRNENNTLSENDQSTSPYGINSGNRGVLPNGADSTSPNNNVNSMVRTNNIDTYKNNTVTNIDGRVYDSNGVLVKDNTNANITNSANDSTFNNYNMTTNSTQNFDTATSNNQNSNQTNNMRNSSVDTIQNSNTTPDTNKNTTINPTRDINTTQTNNSNSTLDNNTKLTPNSNLNDTRNLDIDKKDIQIDSVKRSTETKNEDFTSLNDRLSNLTQSMNEKMNTARDNIARVLDQSVNLDDRQITLLNAYSRVIHCLDIKLAQNHFELMRSAGYLAVLQSEEGTTANVDPINLEMRCILNTREVCLNCMIDALDELNGLFDGIDNETSNTKMMHSSVIATSAAPQTKEYRSTNPNPAHSAHNLPKA